MKKIAIISDIHNNYFALKKFRENLVDENISEYIFLGDYITDGYNTNTILDYIKNKTDNIILGNREINVINMTEPNNTHRWFPTMCAHNEITNDNLIFLKSLPKEKIIKVNNKKIYMCHTNPYNDKELIDFEDKEFLKRIISDKNCDIYLFGHTHFQNSKKYNEKLFINPGSLSCSINTPLALTYGILSIKENGTIDYEPKIKHFDKNEYLTEMLNSDYFKNEPVWASVLINTTLTGIDYYCKFVEFFLTQNYSDMEIENNWENLYNAFCEQEQIPNYVFYNTNKS